MSRRALGGVLLAVLVVTGGGALWSWWRAWNAPLVRVVFRPAFSVHGISTGTPVRVQGVVVGQVTAIGLFVDPDQRLRPEVVLSLDPDTLEDRGFADRLRGARLQEEVERGLRAHLVAVSPASGMLQVELFWDAQDPLPAKLDRDEIPASGVTTQRAIERVVKELERATNRDLALIAQELEADLDKYYAKTDPTHAAAFSARLAASTAAFAEVTSPDNLGAKARRLTESCAALRAAAEAADRRLDGETIGQLQVRLADARAALEAFTASMEGTEAKMNGAAAEVAELFQAVSEAARSWTKKARGLTTEPQPR
jgi:ABC-type transporter Mla subunit MlaD